MAYTPFKSIYIKYNQAIENNNDTYLMQHPHQQELFQEAYELQYNL